LPKNIVLLSDGTGNSAASPFKTNVWRLYQAIDLRLPDDPAIPEQVVLYDNGVGTENIKPLRALGGAFGFGVWRNVKDLYTFACRNYEAGDQIFGFGFSRGAFTIRLVMGLIGKCGIVKTNPHSEANLRKAIGMAYEAYRRDFLLRASRRNGMAYHWVLRKPRYLLDRAGRKTAMIDLTNGKDDTIRQNFIDVAFLGVWDTVDAYGMPVDELKMAIDQHVWPLSFADRDPAQRIKVIRHALSLDDERPTFRPVLWNEEVQDPADPENPNARIALKRDHIQQVWYPGVHANVGGGYPDDGLAYSALDWMMTEASACKLRFVPPWRDEVRCRANPHGEQYDSRSGMAGYYRYGPRDVSLLCDDTRHGVKVPTALVHVDAFDRIARHQRAYAPVSLNKRFQLTGGNAQEYPPVDYMTPELDLLENAWDIVWWRRLNYFATLAATAVVALFFAALVMDWPDAILGYAEQFLSGIAGARIADAAKWIFQTGASGIAFMLPGWLTAALPSFSKYPLTAILSLAILAVLIFRVSYVLKARGGYLAEWAWGAQKGLSFKDAPAPSWMNSIARPGRKVSRFLYRSVWLPVVIHFGGVLIGIVALIVTAPIWIFKVFRRRPWMA
jgi:uncharacterized protein (DUF2235 family)